MPSVKIPRKSTDTDMTPFVDVAFLILAFFMLATKFKPPEPVEILTPSSVSTEKVDDNDAMMVEMDKEGRVFFSIIESGTQNDAKYQVIKNLNDHRKLGLTEAEMQNFVNAGAFGVPFSGLKSLLQRSPQEQAKIKQPGIPILDSATNELVFWVRDAETAMAGRRVEHLIKIDNAAKYPMFKRVLEAFKRNNIYKFKLVTSPEEAPIGSELDKIRKAK